MIHREIPLYLLERIQNIEILLMCDGMVILTTSSDLIPSPFCVDILELYFGKLSAIRVTFILPTDRVIKIKKRMNDLLIFLMFETTNYFDIIESNISTY